MMKIRAFQGRDIDELAEIYISIFAHPPWNEIWKKQWAMERIQWLASMPTFEGLVAEKKEGEIIGAILGKGIPFKGKMEFEIVELFVSLTQQHRGIGTALISTLENRLKAIGVYQIILLTTPDSYIEKFYTSMNFSRNDKLMMMYHRL